MTGNLHRLACVVTLAFCLTLLAGCGRKPASVDEPAGAVMRSYPPAESTTP